MKLYPLFLLPTASAFAPTAFLRRQHTSLDASVGIVFGTSTGSTEEVADAIASRINEVLGSGSCDPPICVDNVVGTLSSTFSTYSSVICGTPTWNTGAETERSGTAWDEVYYGEMGDLKLEGKKVAVFGLGDQESYGENYADASGELYDVLQSLGVKSFGETTVDDSYVHEESKAQRGDKFVGLLCDQANQDDLTPGRVERWVDQLVAEGFFADGAGTAETQQADGDVEVVGRDKITVEVLKEVEEAPSSPVSFDATWKGYRNEKKGSTLWVNQENRVESYTTQN
ncbi:hypothetical protein TrCOL_g9107 [Triparma columacea]|uniref:Flavodoxin-like domain-containing protein n=1 Tax=Triparma columacea TaxID=722753 RepID=A0A9W7G042_9STRA|nr:hypothetical protein TrCOL_g9107 [Triparma columacea]